MLQVLGSLIFSLDVFESLGYLQQFGEVPLVLLFHIDESLFLRMNEFELSPGRFQVVGSVGCYVFFVNILSTFSRANFCHDWNTI